MGRLGQAEDPLELVEHRLGPVAAGKEMALQREGGVLLGHGHELALPPALRGGEIDPAAPSSRKPLLGERGLGHLLGKQDLGCGHDVARVELAEEGGEHVPLPRPPQAVEEERFTTEEAPAADEEELHTGVLPLSHEPHDVLVAVFRGDDLLALAHGVQRLHPVAQPRRDLKFLFGGRRLHLGGQLLGQPVVLALEKALDVAHGLVVALAGLQGGARRVAPVNVVLETRPGLLAVDGDAAGPEGKELSHEAEGLPHGGGGIEGPEVGRAVLLHPPGHHQTRILLVGGQLEEGIMLVVPEDDVVARAVPLDQIRFEDQGLELVAGDDELEVPHLPHQGVGLGVVGSRVLEVRAYASPERGRLAHVDDLPLGVLVEVDTGPVGKQRELRREVDGGYAHSHSVTTRTARPIAAGMRTVQRSIRSNRRSTGGRGRPGRGGFRKEITLERATKVTDSTAKKMSVHLMTMAARAALSGPPARPS
jgi:hypothetical protein